MDWNTVLSAAQLDKFFADTAKLDPRFAREQRAFYSSRTPAQLSALKAQAWQCNDREGYVLAVSFGAGAV